MKQLIFFICLLGLATACNNGSAELKALQDEVNATHDAAMKTMADMNRVARSIKETVKADSLSEEQLAQIMPVLKTIGDAENDMMNWMANYSEPTDKPAGEAKKYLQEQLELIKKNQEDMLNATKAAKQFLPGDIQE
ncbi:MAG: hypothetical protein R3A50_18610 [Saprospiraceae bacterium]|nr:hypothetical protein [Saprospiraceae bacterium]MCB9342490.1 hypothetical protein [Lewinellaceae bacterium]